MIKKIKQYIKDYLADVQLYFTYAYPIGAAQSLESWNDKYKQNEDKIVETFEPDGHHIIKL